MLKHNSRLSSLFNYLFSTRRSNNLLFVVFATISFFVISEPGRILAERFLSFEHNAQIKHTVSRGHRFFSSCFINLVLFFFFCNGIYFHHQFPGYSHYCFLFATISLIDSFKLIQQIAIFPYCYPRQLYNDTS